MCAGEVEKMGKKMVEVEGSEVPVVAEAYLEDARKGGALLKIPSHTISSWGAPRHSLTSSAAEDEMTDCGGHSFKSTGTLSSELSVMAAPPPPLSLSSLQCHEETYSEGKLSC